MNRHARVSALLLAALELDADVRGEFLDRECHDDPELRGEVESLLAQEGAVSEFLDEPIVEFLASKPVPLGIPGTTSLPVERVATVSFDGAAPPIPSEVHEFSAVRHYRIVREIGRGGMGVVYEGLDESLNRRVAIKAIHWDRAADTERRARFRQEARLLAALDHPNVGAIHSFEETDEGHFLILEFVEGESLGQMIGEAPLSVESAVDIARQVASALQAAHERGIVHRDLSPGNVMVRHDGVAKVLDFGLARSIGVVGGTNTQSTGPIAGTPSFMSPELLHGAPSTRAADSWAFACLLFESLTGERAFNAATLPGIFDRVLHGQPPLDRLPAETPAGVKVAIERCWIKDPAQRLADMGVVLELLSCDSNLALNANATAGRPRFAASWQPLVRRVASNHPVAMRLWLDNPQNTTLTATVAVESGGGWSDCVAVRTLEVAPGAAVELFLATSCEPAGSHRLPAALVTVDGTERRVLAVPSTVDVDADSRPLLSRSQEVSRMGEWIDRIADDPGAIFVVRGPGGSGKSQLLDCAVDYAVQNGVRVVRAEGRTGMGEPLELVLDLVRSYLGLFEPLRDRDPRVAFARGRLRELLGESSPATTYFLDLLRGAEGDAFEGPMQLYRWTQLLAATVSSAPTLLVIDDIGRADARSLEILEGVLRRVRSDGLALAALVARESHDDRLASERAVVDPLLSGDLAVESIDLAPFEASDIDALISETFPGSNHRDYVPGLAEILRSHTGGQPGAVLETLRALEGDAAFRREGTTWRVSADFDLESRVSSIPVGYDELVQARLASVGEGSRATLDFSALLGVEFDIDPLAALVGSDEELDEALDDLERSRVVEPVDSSLTRYRFTHAALPREVVGRVNEGGSRRAARLKRKVAAALVEHFGEKPRAREREELGLRLIDLGKSAAALPHLLVALGHRVQRRQVSEANRVVQRIEQIAEQCPIDDPAQSYEWLSLRGRAQVLAGRLEEAESSIEAARQLAERAGDRSGVLVAMVQLSEVASRRGRNEAGRDLALAARESALGTGDNRVAAEAGRNLAVAYRRLGQRDRAREIWTEDLQLAVQQSDAMGELRCQHNLGILLYELREWEQAEARFTRAAEIAQDLGHLEFEMIARAAIANVALGRGELAEARRGYRIAIEAFRQLHIKRPLSRNYFNLAQVEALDGDFAQAVHTYERAVALCAEIGDEVTEARYRIDLAHAALYAGDRERATHELQSCDESEDDALRLPAALLAERLGDRRALEAVAAEMDGTSTTDLDEGESSSIERLAVMTMRVRLDPARATDTEFLESVRSLLRTSHSIAELHDRVRLAAAIDVGAGRSPDLASITILTGDDLSPFEAWAEAVLVQLR